MTTARRLGILMAAGCLCALVAGSFVAAEEKVDLKVGDKAPSFEAKDDQGKEWKSSDHVGKKLVVVYFYPADFTGGCTKQACSYRDDMDKLTEKGIEVVGVSGDTVQNHEMFKKYHKLNYTLLADPEGNVAKKFGVPTGKGGPATGKNAEGKDVPITRGVTESRWTFVIDKDGKIIYKNDKVNPTQDTKQLLEFVEKQAK